MDVAEILRKSIGNASSRGGETLQLRILAAETITYSNSSGCITLAAKVANFRIKSSKLLEESGWRFFGPATDKANIVLEPKVKLTNAAIDRA